MSLLPKKKKPIEADISKISLMLYGLPKSGKSTFASYFPEPLFLPFERGLDGLEVFQAPPTGIIESRKQLYEIVSELKNLHKNEGKLPYKTIVLDTMSGVVDVLTKHVCKEHGVEALGDIPRGTGYTLVTQSVIRLVKTLQSMDVAVILICHGKVEKRETKNHGDYDVVTIDLGGKTATAVKAAANVMAYIDEVDTKGQDGKKVRKSLIRLMPDPYSHDAGNRLGVALPDMEIDHTDWAGNYARFKDNYESALAAKAKAQSKEQTS